MDVLKEAKARKKGFQNAIVSWARNNMRVFPWREGERTPYSVLIAGVLLKRTTSKAVLRVYSDFLARFPDIFSLVEADERELIDVLSKIGLQRQRARGLKEVSSFIYKEYEGEIPRALDRLTRIPHIGSYTACAVMSFGFGIPVPIVDSNVIRIFSRFFASTQVGITEDACWDIAWELIPEKDHEIFNWGLLDLGALVCTFREAFHEKCPLRMICDTVTAQETQ